MAHESPVSRILRESRPAGQRLPFQINSMLITYYTTTSYMRHLISFRGAKSAHVNFRKFIEKPREFIEFYRIFRKFVRGGFAGPGEADPPARSSPARPAGGPSGDASARGASNSRVAGRQPHHTRAPPKAAHAKCGQMRTAAKRRSPCTPARTRRGLRRRRDAPSGPTRS